MSIQAVLIDAENMSCALAPVIMAEAKKQGVPTQPYVYGRKEALRGWQEAISLYAMQVRTHEGGKNAADHLLLQDARALFEQQGVRNFCLVSNDGGFAPHVHLLCVAGCEVTIIGNTHAAKQLKKAGTRFVAISKKSGDKHLPISTAETEKGSLGMSILHQWNEPASQLGDDAGHEEPDARIRKITALHDLYGQTYPTYLFTMLSLVLEQCFRDLCLEGKDVFIEVREPQEVEAVLEDLKRDPVFEGILIVKELAQQWQHLLLFARRCRRAWQQGWEAANAPFAALPVVDARSHLFEQRRKKDVERWRPYHLYEQNLYPSGYSEETEQGILRRWYQQGYAAQTMELAISHHAAWVHDEVLIGDGE